MELELDNVPFASANQVYTIHRSGFATAYERNYHDSLSSRISSEHYYAILETVSRIHDRFPILPAFAQAFGLLLVLSILEVILAAALFTPLVLGIGLFICIAGPIGFIVINIMIARDHQIANASAFLNDANAEFRHVGITWKYDTPHKPLQLLVDTDKAKDNEIVDNNDDLEQGRHAWALSNSKTRCCCFFMTIPELEEKQVLVDTNIPLSSKQTGSCRISVFPSGRIRLTLVVALVDVKSAWLQLNDLHKLTSEPEATFTIWESSHRFHSKNLLDLLQQHDED